MKLTPISTTKNQHFTSIPFKKNKPYSYVIRSKFPFIQKHFDELLTPYGLYSKGELETVSSSIIPPEIRQQALKYSKHKQKIPENTYFIRMEQYRKDKNWAKQMEELTYIVSYLIHQKMSFENLMAAIEKEIKTINNECSYFGTKRIQNNIFQICEIGRGSEYYDKYINEMSETLTGKISPKPSEEFKDANTTTIRWDNRSSCVEVAYGKMDKKTNLEHIKNLYNILITTKDPEESQINKIVAAIHWLFAQQTPYERGSDSIANVLTKSIYHCYDMEISPIKQYHSLDFEAFHLDAKDFIEHYTDFFEKCPKKLS